jgi:hypothetical protein
MISGNRCSRKTEVIKDYLNLLNSISYCKEGIRMKKTVKKSVKIPSRKLSVSARLRAASETNLAKKTFLKACEWTIKDIFPGLEKKYH